MCTEAGSFVARRMVAAASSTLLCCSVLGQPAEKDAIRLWSDKAPGALGDQPKDVPTLTAFRPEPGTATGASLVICPGGGYGHLAKHEGAGYAQFFVNHGITAFVLKYRLGSDGYRDPAMLQDAARAVRLVRSRAAEWSLDPNRVGIVGSSAGGHLASTLMTHWKAGDLEASDPVERVSSRPDLGILCYPVISMGPLTHEGSRRNLLGEDPAPDRIESLSNEKQVSTNTPPCFIWHTVEDKTVKVENSLEFAMALRRAQVPFELHLYEKGGHGMGLGRSEVTSSGLHPWTVDCLRWLGEQGFLR